MEFVFCEKHEEKIGKKVSKNLSIKYSQKLLDHVKQSAIDALKTTSKRAIQKEANSDLIRNKIAGKITKFGRISLQNNSETVESETKK